MEAYKAINLFQDLLKTTHSEFQLICCNFRDLMFEAFKAGG